MDNTEFRVKQFEKFYHFLMKDSPEGYKPWFFPCDKKGKNPCAFQIMKNAPKKSLCCNDNWIFRITNEEKEKEIKAKPQWRCDKCEKTKGSWHSLHARLNKEQVISHIKQGFNIGLSARNEDPLIIGDIDEEKYMNQLPTDTLTSTSRKRAGGHFFGLDKDGTAKINLPTEYGEMRSNNQYVLAPGSYVKFNLENEKDKKAFDSLPKEAKEDKLIGFYTVREAQPLKQISFGDLPLFFREKAIDDQQHENNEEIQKEYTEFKGKGKYSQLLKLKISDILGKIPSNKRKSHPLHESDTDANFSLDKEGNLGMCWRHLVSLNAVQYLCVKAGYSKCMDAGTPHRQKGQPKRNSKIKGDKKALEVAYKEAVKMRLIEEFEGKDNIGDKRFLTWVEKFNSYIVNIEVVADYFSNKYDFITISNSGKDKLYLHNGKCYKENAKAFIKEKFEILLGKYAKINPLNEVTAKIERKNYMPMEDFEKTDINLIPLENGVFNLETKKLQNHSPKNYFKTIVPIEYNEIAKCSIFLKFLNEALYPEDIPVMQEWFGFNLYRIYLIKKAMLCIGGQDAGKTVLLDTLIEFVGELNKTGLSLQKISSGSDFVKLSLKDKYSNVYDDLSSKDLNDGGNFKIATGGGFISAEEKFGGYYQFKSFAKQTLAGNKSPPIKDNDDPAYFGRFIVIKFDNVPEKKDLFLKDKIKNELPGILNWALEGLFRLLKNGEFSYKKNAEEVKTIMEMSGDPLIQFGAECLCESKEKVSKENMYEIYSIWANENDKPILSKEQLGRRLNQKIKYLVAKTGAKERFWDNVSINEDWELKLSQKSKKSEKQQKTLKIDTLDTSRNIMSKCPEVVEPILDMINLKASNPSKCDSCSKPTKTLYQSIPICDNCAKEGGLI